VLRIIKAGYSVEIELSRQTGEGVTFSKGYLSARLNDFHEHLLEKWHSFLMVN